MLDVCVCIKYSAVEVYLCKSHYYYLAFDDVIPFCQRQALFYLLTVLCGLF